jgi:hypothetical protein
MDARNDSDVRRELAADVQRLADFHTEINAKLIQSGWTPPAGVYLCTGELIELAERIRLGN